MKQQKLYNKIIININLDLHLFCSSTHMDLYIVASYIPCFGQSARVYMDGIYSTFEDAEQRQKDMCGGSIVSTHLGNNSMYGGNGRITWMKKVKMGDLQKLDIYSPDSLSKS